MRLINNRSLELELFHGDTHPPYAILSHTWAEEEVTFQDMKDLRARPAVREMKGWVKIQRTCDRARGEKIPYAWVDTCCIDKSSGAELSEAINSMFRWYQDAEVCYVDLPELIDMTDSTQTASLRHCRWFTRGWTLQELIAPKQMKFFDSEWRSYRSREDLETVLSIITGIQADALRGDVAVLDQICAARKMSWAAGRQTTKVEDAAYSLLGIFDINMPMLYGEGAKAFIRLQEEIFKKTADLSLLAWCSDDPEEEFSGVFARSPSEFWSCSQFRLRYPRPPPDSCAVAGSFIKIINPEIGQGPSPKRPSPKRPSREELRLDPCLDLGVVHPTHGRHGIFLRKTPDGYVRSAPSARHTFGGQLRGSSLQEYTERTLYLQAQLPRWTLEPLKTDLINAIALIVKCSNAFTIQFEAVEPCRFFDPVRNYFLRGDLLSLEGRLMFRLAKHFEPAPFSKLIVSFGVGGKPDNHTTSIMCLDDLDVVGRLNMERDFPSQSRMARRNFFNLATQKNESAMVRLPGKTALISVSLVRSHLIVNVQDMP